MKAFALALLCTIGVAPVLAQRDFLTPDEADQIRLAQEPEVRLKTYLKFADQRVDLLEQLFAKEKTGRSGVMHDTLEQLTKIVEAIDIIIDETLHKRRELTTVEFVAKREREILKKLEAWSAIESADAERFAFALDTAIDTVRDSAEMAEEDLRARTRAVDTREADYKKQREAMMTPEQKETSKKAAEKEQEAAKKKPTLMRKGETAPNKKQP